WFAIGGIQADNLQQVLEAGATRVAVSGVICSHEHPGQITRELLEQLSN
ncbi:MAG TPA: thiamine phosphate synthase, partial [Gimesia maris]|nr:thiamine phosphate synthase [Gimesia maris]